MASFTISLSGSGVVNGSKSWTISDSDVQNLLNHLTAKYAGAGSSLTAQQVLLAWTQDFVNRTIADVKTYQQATAAITPVVFT